ncbi:hypothetical protein CH375_04725 [Leptospira ellisii]|uniref:DUF2281 domain-containing protein n=1 Tax=Leptospira ellisii TaxID=2023197 RepID=A0A2N0BBD5_9LEPT|nr:hypothetical protein CH379_05605 [Leptospira ellisii]PKA05517.1 hypothetical protein CH375_04725 [Leptospira ellisii]
MANSNDILINSILALYSQVSNKKKIVVKDLYEDFFKLKVREPLVQSSEHLGKVPMEFHLLEDDLTESPFWKDVNRY